MMQIVWSPRARRSILEIARYIKTKFGNTAVWDVRQDPDALVDRFAQ